MSIGMNYYSFRRSRSEPCVNSRFFKNDGIVRDIDKRIPSGSLLNFYMTLMAADITEDMLLSAPDGRYDEIENMIKKVRLGKIPENWYTAVFEGKYGLAENILSSIPKNLSECRGFGCIIMSERADFIDIFTADGSNSNYIKIMLCVLTQDYLRGGKAVFEYVKRYSADKNFSEDEYLDKALLAVNDPDRIYRAICSETAYIMRHSNAGIDVREYNRRAAKLMCRCAEFKMTLKNFSSFSPMFIYPNNFFKSFAYGNEEEAAAVSEPKTELPAQLAELIDSETSVCGIGYQNCQNSENHLYYLPEKLMPVYFKNTESENAEAIYELEYIALKFKEKYGCRLKLNVNINDLRNLRVKYSDIIEPNLSRRTMVKIYNNRKLLKHILEQHIFSEDNINALIKCCTEEIEKNQNRNAMTALNEIHNFKYREKCL